MATCKFCDRPAEHACAWWCADRIVSLWPTAVKAGMTAACRLGAGQEIRPEVVGVELSPYSGGTEHHYVVRVRWQDREYVWIRSASNPVHIYQPAPCGNQVCFAHAREVDSDRHYCSEHWQACFPKDVELASEVDLTAQRAIDRELLGAGARIRGGRAAARRAQQLEAMAEAR